METGHKIHCKDVHIGEEENERSIHRDTNDKIDDDCELQAK